MAMTGYAGAADEKARELSVSTLIEDFERDLERAGKVVERVASIADKLAGSIPRGVEGSPKETAARAPSGLLGSLRTCRERFSARLIDIEGELNRIENGL